MVTAEVLAMHSARENEQTRYMIYDILPLNPPV